MIDLLITGARGRMGQALLSCAENFPGINLIGGVDIGDNIANFADEFGYVIDFTTHSYTSELLKVAVSNRIKLVIGTTGHTNAEIKEIKKASEKTAIVHAPNFSIGVNTLFWTAKKVHDILGSDFDMEVVEMHHNKKTDAPSGTAKRLAEILCEARKLSYEKNVSHGRVGDVGARKQDEIGMHSLRGGDVVGDHTVIFSADGERIELSHKASSRNTFANGALRSAIWLKKQDTGLYSMQDVLGL